MPCRAEAPRVGQFARRYEGRVVFLTSPGLASTGEMSEAVEDFGWPNHMVHAVDPDGSLWSHFGIRFRGSWVFISDDGQVTRTSPHPPASEVEKELEELVAR